MQTPLYNKHNAPTTIPNKEPHLGLWYTRFFNHYTNDWDVDQTAKSGWVNKFAGKRCGIYDNLNQHALNLLQLNQTLDGKFAVCETNWHFATGLGLPHPVENGLTWHPTLGVPFLAGSAIKGLLRAWVEIWDDTDRDQRLKNWFGEQEEAGKLIFFDAIPIKPVTLTADILTPHYGKWHEKGHEIQGRNMSDIVKNHHDKLPADWHEPVPVPFLAVKSATFLISIAARNSKDKNMAATAFESLLQALEFTGAGSKTAVGYGHMIRKESEEKSLLNELNKKPESKKPEPKDNYRDLIKQLETAENPKQLAERIKVLMKKEKKWKETSKAKRPDRDKDHQRTLLVMNYLK